MKIATEVTPLLVQIATETSDRIIGRLKLRLRLRWRKA